MSGLICFCQGSALLVLAEPDFAQSFMIEVDAIAYGGGAVVLQGGDYGIDHPVWYFLEKFNKNQENYSAIEKEAQVFGIAAF